MRESGLGFRSRAGGTAREAVGSEGNGKAVMARELRPVRGAARRAGRVSAPRARGCALSVGAPGWIWEQWPGKSAGRES